MGISSYWVAALQDGEPIYEHHHLFELDGYWYSIWKSGLEIFNY